MPSMQHQQAFANWAGGSYPQAGETQPIMGPAPAFRDPKDRQLAAFGATPDVNYPDGYLGTQPATSRRSDKLVDAVYRNNMRSYTRGVHKGERINPGDYLWPDEFNMYTGLEMEAQGLRFTPQGGIPTHLTNDGKVGPQQVPGDFDRQEMEIVDRNRQSLLSHLLPNWR
jgi:hypothetical protein